MTRCAYCGENLDSHTPLGGNISPENGDFGFCAYCGEFNIFMDGEMIKVEYDVLDNDTLAVMKKVTETWERAKEAEL